MLNLQEIIQMITSKQGVSDYKIIDKLKSSYELFFVHGKVETVRKSESDDRQICVYVNHDDRRGMSSFNVFASTDADELSQKLDSAISKARLIFDEPYVLPDSETCDETIASDLAELDPQEVAAKLAQAISEANTHENCDINALEIFVVKEVLHVVNSRGVDKTQTKHTVQVEAIPTANGETDSVELFESYELASLDLEWLKRELGARLDDVNARLIAKKPEQPLSCPIVLNANELKDMFSEIVPDLSYANAYMHVNLHSVGDALQSAPEGDRLCITMRGNMQGSPAGNVFDLDGTTLTDREIVHDGRVVAGYGTSRFAGYLGKTPTGALQCIDVKEGEKTCEELLREPHLELVYLSGLQVDMLSDYIGGEIRLAYYFDGQTRTPVTGIAFSAKLSEALNTVELSSERTTLGNYSGPAKLKLRGANIF